MVTRHAQVNIYTVIQSCRVGACVRHVIKFDGKCKETFLRSTYNNPQGASRRQKQPQRRLAREVGVQLKHSWKLRAVPSLTYKGVRHFSLFQPIIISHVVLVLVIINYIR